MGAKLLRDEAFGSLDPPVSFVQRSRSEADGITTAAYDIEAVAD